MPEELFGRWALLGVDREGCLDEVAELLRPSLADTRWLPRDDIDHDSALWLADIGRIALRKLKGEDAETPNVNLRVVPSLALDQFRSHPAESTDFARPGRPLLC